MLYELLAATNFAVGQTNSSTVANAEDNITAIDLEVTDQSGAVIPHVAVRITDHLGIVQQAAETDESGRFRSRSLRPETYAILLKMPGFKPTKQSVEVKLHGVSNVRIIMEVSPTTWDGPYLVGVPLEQSAVSSQIEPRPTSQPTSKAKKARTPAKPKP